MRHLGRSLPDAELTGHPEVDDESATVIEVQEEVLPPPAHGPHGGADGGGGARELGRRVGVGLDDRASDEHGLEATSDGLDLGQFGHDVTVPALP